MADISQTTFANAFPGMKIYEFRINVSQKYVPKGQNLQYFRIGLDNGLVPTWQPAIIWANDGQFIDACVVVS